MYGEWLELLKDKDLCLSDAEIGIVMVAVLEYIQSGVIPKFSDRGLTAVFKTIKGQIDKDGEKYDETCKARKDAVKKRWGKAASRVNGSECDTKESTSVQMIQKYTNDTDNDNDDDNNEHNSLSESMCVDARTRTRTQESEAKTPYGFFQNVYLSDKEMEVLRTDFGEEKLKKAIMLLSARIQKDGKYKDDSHAAVIRLWVMEAVDEQEVRKMEREERKKKARGDPAGKMEKAKNAGFDFELEDIFEKP